MFKQFFKNSALVIVGMLLSLVIAEVVLRIYNPFNFRIRGQEIILPANQERIYKNYITSGLERNVIYRYNSLGFRGPDPPYGFDNYFSIIAVGGSTTKCGTISEGKTWVDIFYALLKEDIDDLWVNNAGLDGHSTFGHNILLRDHIVNYKPDMLLFLIGANDIGRDDLRRFDAENIKRKLYTGSIKGFILSLSSDSEVFSLMANMYRFLQAKSKRLVHHEIDYARLSQKINVMEVKEAIERNKKLYLPLYKDRVMNLIKISKQTGSEPVLITQPALSGMDLEAKYTESEYHKDNKDYILYNDFHWQILELYNSVTRDIAVSEKVLLIDLAREMPKTTDYFYDKWHFTNDGAEFVGDYVYKKLQPYLSEKYFQTKYGADTRLQ